MIKAFKILESPSELNSKFSVKVLDIIKDKITWIGTVSNSLVAKKYFRWGYGSSKVKIGDVIFLNQTPSKQFRLISEEQQKEFFNQHLEYFV